MKKFAILFLGVSLLTSGSGCCWWGWPFGGGYGGGYRGGHGGGYGYNGQYGVLGSPNCPGGNCGVPGTMPLLGNPSSSLFPNSISTMQPVFSRPVSAPITAGLPIQIHPAMPQTAMRYIESLPTY